MTRLRLAVGCGDSCRSRSISPAPFTSERRLIPEEGMWVVSDPPTNGNPGDASLQQTAAQDVLTELRHLLVGPEQRQLGTLQERLDTPHLYARDVSRVLPEAILLRTTQDHHLQNALQPVVEEAIQASVQRDPRALVEALFPLIGPAIRKAITSALRSMLESFNHTLDVSLSWRGLRWRLAALRTGKPFAEIVLLHSLHYRVEQVFLIHQETGLLLQHVVAKSVPHQPADVVSGMLTAIQDFMRDSFGLPGTETLGTVQVGELTLWIEPGPLAMLVAVVRGNASNDLQTLLQETLEAIHPDHHQALIAFNGDSTPFASTRPYLEACLLTQYLPPPRHVSPVVWAVCALFLLGLRVWGVSTIHLNQRWAHYLDTLQAHPGLVVTSAGKRNGKFWLVGLRDPLAADPLQLLHQSEIDPDAVSSHWEPYHSFHPGFVLARARTILDPPATVALHLDHHTLSATGAAPHSWIVEARRAVRALPSIERFQTDQLVDTTRQELTSVREHIEQSMLFFVKGSAQPLPGQEATLVEVAAAMQRILEVALAVGQQARMDVIGQADKTGSEDKNRQLSRERADYVFSSLVLSGVPPSVLSAVGIGSHGAVDDARVKEERVLHRRVSFKVHLTVHPNQEDTAP